MANDYFQFRQFTVRQDRCAMKVGTDGTLLGAWANVPLEKAGRSELPAHGEQPQPVPSPRVLDIGTGTGLIALMMAQRFPTAAVVGIDIDSEAVGQARDNVASSPFAKRIEMVEGDVVEAFAHQRSVFDAIVSNPPYFEHSLQAPDERRTAARHATTLTYEGLLLTACRLLNDSGELSVVVPFDCLQRFDAEASLAGLFKVRQCAVRTTPRKAPRRYLLAYALHPRAVELTEGIVERTPGVRSEWYAELTKDFYL